MSGIGALVPVELITEHPGNVREQLGDVSELVASIRSLGMMQPLVVQKHGGAFQLVDGHRRFRAALLLGLKSVPCIAVKPSVDGGHDVARMLAAAMHRALTPLEQGRAFAVLERQGLSRAEISRKTGYAQSTVSARLLLAGLPQEAQAMVEAGKMTAAAATDLARDVVAKREGTTRTRAAGVPRPVWFAKAHRLAGAVKGRCVHTDRAVVGGMGCGQCWEDEIRLDERERVSRRSTGGAA